MMRKFFERMDDSIVSKDAKELMIKAQSFNRIIMQAKGINMMGSYNLNALDTMLRSEIKLAEVLKVMKDNEIYLTVEDGLIQLLIYTMEEDEMSEKDVAFFFMDKLDNKISELEKSNGKRKENDK